MKALAKFCLFLGFLAFWGCDRDLKEHKVPPATLKKLERQYDPALKEKEITGTISLENGQVSSPEGSMLFLFVRPEGVNSGPPLAAKRIGYFEFPYEFAIGPKDIMMPGAQFEGNLSVTARLDHDGDAKARPGDLLGKIIAKPGDKGVKIVLNQSVQMKSQTISGTLQIDKSVEGKVPPNAVLFIIAKKKGPRGTPPIAVQRITDPTFPLDFKIGQKDVMMPNAEFDGDILLTARLDQDGSAMGQSGDVEGVLPAQAGENNVVLTLDHVIGG